MPELSPEWLEKRDVILFQRMLVEEHRGLQGIRDEGSLESTLARPMQLLHYRPDASIFELAASYGHVFAKSHVFLDGNKRISLASIDIFLQINGFQLTAEEADAVLTIRDVATGVLEEPGLAAWIRNNLSRFDLDAIS